MSLAIAYAMKKKKKCHGGEMAHGGDVEMDMVEENPQPVMSPMAKGMKKAFHAPGYAEGGEVEEEMKSGHEPMPCEKCGHVAKHAVENQGMGEEEDMIGRIMKKRQMFSKGGQVANEDEPMADSEPAEYDDLVKEDGLEFHETGENSGDEIGDDEEDEDRKDVVSRIMKSRKKKDKMPRPA